jgi:excisionase family DNA binding protein
MKQLANPTPASSAVRWAPRRKDTERRFLSVAEVARYCGIADVEVLTWIDSGELRAARVAIGRYRIAVGDLLAFLARFHLAL